MSQHRFQFKEFTVQQDRCAMKIGTDGVLLGAWTECIQANSILDIGTGTGVIALQMAQRSVAELIDAIEIEDNAYEQSVDNFEASDWSDRLFCYHASLQQFVDEIDDKYDLIVSNPPFYTSSFKKGSIEENRSVARHSENMSFELLLNSISQLLEKNGNCAFVIPFEEEENFIEIASQNSIFPNRITRVKGTSSSPIKRSLIQLSFHEEVVEIDELIIEVERHVYTDKYINLVKDFYIKM